MKTRLSLVLLLLGVAAQVFVHAQGQVRLLRPGTFLIDPPRLQASEQWYALHRAGDRRNLSRVVPTVRAAPPICGDRATQVSLAGVDGVLFLITGLQKLSEGPVVTTIAEPRFLYPGEEIDIGVRPQDGYRLEALGRAIREVGGFVLTDYTLWVRHRQQVHAVASFARATPDHPRRVVWAGDVDRDLRPDLLFDFPLGDVGHHYVLFLSSAATGEQLVSQVAVFSTPGC